MALLQKSIRRGACGRALQAASTLLNVEPQKLWRRLVGIAFEDVGLADVHVVALIRTVLEGKPQQADFARHWPFVSHLVMTLVETPKNRACDDLLMIADRHPRNARDRLYLRALDFDALISTATGPGLIDHRAIALLCAAEMRNIAGRPMSRGDVLQEMSHRLVDADWDPHVVETAIWGFTQTGERLQLLLPLLHPLHASQGSKLVHDEMPPETLCGPLPSWAVDMFSREGKLALRRFITLDCPSARWIRDHIRPRDRVSFVGDVLFYTEGQLCRRRQHWALSDDLRRQAMIECHGPECPDATEIIDLMRDDIPVLNRVRADVV